MAVSKTARKIRNLFVLFLSLLPVSLVFQNCGNVNIAPHGESTEPSIVDSSAISYLNIDHSGIDIFRAAFIIDMSDSMYSGPCPDSIDTLIEGVTASENCMGPTGVDPYGNRFKIILKWIEDLEAAIRRGAIQASQIKMLIVPFSGGLVQYDWGLGTINYRIATKIGPAIGAGFNTLDVAKKHLFILWAMESKKHEASYAAVIPNEIRNAVDAAGSFGGNKASTGTSIVAPAMDTMNLAINTELNTLTTAQIKKTHFEAVYLSDGVPKPHPLHIEEAAKLVWRSKKTVCDYTQYPANQSCGGGYDTEHGWVTVDGTKCLDRCGDYLKVYADTAAVNLPNLEKPVPISYSSIPYTPNWYSAGGEWITLYEKWSTKIKCGPCFEILKQFSYSRGTPSRMEHHDDFKEKSKLYWGDWTLNRHSHIIAALKATQNIFKVQFRGAKFKMSFLRMDSSIPKFRTPAVELDQNLNWIEKAKNYFAKKHRFYTVKNDVTPFALFSELGQKQSYRLGLLYAYNRTLLADNRRSDGICLDGIKKKFGACINLGCSSQLDVDGDGLNECEEVTVGSDTMEADSDTDGALDGVELFFKLNPMINDQTLYTNTDGFSNFDHFVRGYSPTTNLSKVPAQEMIVITKNLFGYKTIKDSRGFDIEVPGYEIKIQNMPLKKDSNNEIVVIARVDNLTNPSDVIWFSKIYTVNASTGLKVKLEDLGPLKLERP